jgi:hypothetical protein
LRIFTTKYIFITPYFHFSLNLNQQNHSLLLFSYLVLISLHSFSDFILERFNHQQLIYSILFLKHLVVTQMLQNFHLIQLAHFFIHLLLLYFMGLAP